MNREKFTREKWKIFFYMVVYSLICEAFSLFVFGFDWRFTFGLIMGICAVTVNLTALEKVVDCAIDGKQIWLAFLLHMGRFLLFGVTGYLCYRIDIIALAAYGIGVLGLTVASVITYVKEG